MFSRLYVSCHVRDGDLEGFFGHQNQSFPLSLSQYGNLRSGTKSDLLSCLEKNGPAQAQRPSVEALLLDGEAIFNMLKPGASKIFQEHSETVILPVIRNKPVTECREGGCAWDRYLPGSLKDSARSKRGKGIHRRVRPDTRIQGDWKAFLRVDENKKHLFLYEAEQLTTIGTDHGEVLSTKHETVDFNNDRTDATDLSPCTHEEADTRLLLYSADDARCAYIKVMIRTVDTDFVVIAVAKFQCVFYPSFG